MNRFCFMVTSCISSSFVIQYVSSTSFVLFLIFLSVVAVKTCTNSCSGPNLISNLLSLWSLSRDNSIFSSSFSSLIAALSYVSPFSTCPESDASINPGYTSFCLLLCCNNMCPFVSNKNMCTALCLSLCWWHSSLVASPTTVSCLSTRSSVSIQ